MVFSLSCSQKQAVISLLAKSGKDNRLFKDKDQSVSLLNVDAKLFSKDLVKRIIKVLPKLNHTDQCPL